MKRLRYQISKEYYSTKGLENDYALGFIKGLHNAFDKQKSSNKEWGLLLTKDQAVIDRYNEMKFSRSVNTSTSFTGFNIAYKKGVEDDEKFSITDKIAREGNKVLELQ